MDNNFILLLRNWISAEPVPSLWLAIAMAALTAMAYASGVVNGKGLWAWIQRLGYALSQGLALLSVVGVFLYLLMIDYSVFSKVHNSFTADGSLSRTNWQEWRNSYGGRLVQRDLMVDQFIQTEAVETLTPTDSAAPVLYRTAIVEQSVVQNSITSFQGQVTIRLAHREDQINTFNAYTLAATYIYEVNNPTDLETRARFTFPLMWEANLYQDVIIKVNEREIPWFVDAGSIVWELPMEPLQELTISISYDVRGMDGFVYEVSNQREITNFLLVVTMDTENC